MKGTGAAGFNGQRLNLIITMRYILELSLLTSMTLAGFGCFIGSAHAAAPRYIVGTSEVSVGQAIQSSLAGNEVWQCKLASAAISKAGTSIGMKAVKAVRK